MLTSSLEKLHVALPSLKLAAWAREAPTVELQQLELPTPPPLPSEPNTTASEHLAEYSNFLSVRQTSYCLRVE